MKYLGKILRASERKRDNTRDRAKLIIRQMNEVEDMVREARERERNTRSEAIIVIIE